MKLIKIQLFFLSYFLSMITSTALGQNASYLKINVGDDQGSSVYEMVFGNNVSATWGMNGEKDSLWNPNGDIIEKESPPLPPGLGVVWRPARSGVSWGIGFLKYDIKDWTDATRSDTFRLYFANAQATDAEITISWPDSATLGLRCTGLILKVGTDYYDMFHQTSLVIPNAGDNGISQVYIYKTGAFLVDGLIDSGVKQERAIVPEEFKLYSNYPNPFNPATTIRFDVLKVAKIDLIVYNITGEIVANIVSETLPPGTYSFTWNGMNSSNVPVASGVYFVRMIARDGGIDQYSALQKILLVK